MDQLTPQQLIDQFFSIVNEGNEEMARKFLLDHINEFPEESRDAIITAFVEDAIAKQSNDNALLQDVKIEALETAHAMSAFKKEAEKQAKLGDIRKGL